MPEIIEKSSETTADARMSSYEEAHAGFSWGDAHALLAGLPDAGLNIAHEAVDRHVADGRGERLAVRWRGRKGERRDLSYRDLQASSGRFAALLEQLGVQPGERVFLLLGRVPELYEVVLGALKARCVVCPLFSAFGPEPIHQRMTLGGGTVLVTTPALYRRRIARIRERLPNLRHIVLIGRGGALKAKEQRPDTVDYHASTAGLDGDYEIGPTPPQTPALLHFTSGTTGLPKGVLHVHEAVVHHRHSAEVALDLGRGDVFWCTADPGWVTGLSYGVIAPLVLGATLVAYEGEFDAAAWIRLLAEEGVQVWYTAPTAVRMLMKLDSLLPERLSLPALRFIASVGEPLNPEAVRWGATAFGLPIHDNWWQTETGGILLANFRSSPVRPGSMGRPLPGITAAVVRRAPGGELTLLGDDEEGELAIRTGWPSMFREYLGRPKKTAACFSGDWYLTGDLARRDCDGFYWFVGRADDVINTAGHLVGPFEVESALMEHPAVAEAAAIGKPDPIAMEVVKAFVALRSGHVPGEALRRELQGLARKRLGPAVAPKEISFVSSLPKTRSGKIMRRLLKARELGLPEGDTSTLEPPCPEPPGTALPAPESPRAETEPAGGRP